MSTAIQDIPAGLTGNNLIQTINDRLRTIQQGLANTFVAGQGALDMGGYQINNLGNPKAGTDAVNLQSEQASRTGTTTTVQAAAAPTPTQLILTVPGTLAIESNAAALVQLQSTQSFTTVVLLVKQAPVGAALTIQAVVGSTTLGTVSISDGAVSSSASVTWTVPAGQVLMFSITGVGLTFPGSDLTIQLQP
jgi:hypothetical protein